MRRRLSVVERAPARAPADEALQALALALAPYLRPLLAGRERGAELVDVAAVVPIARRTLYKACRAGRIAGAALVGRRWLAPRGAVEAWLQASGPRLVKGRDEDEDEDDLEPLRRSLMRRSLMRTGRK